MGAGLSYIPLRGNGAFCVCGGGVQVINKNSLSWFVFKCQRGQGFISGSKSPPALLSSVRLCN